MVSERADLLSVPAVHSLHRRSPVVLSSFVKWAVRSQAEETPTETREPESEEEEDHWQDEEEDDKQGDSDGIRFSSRSGWAAVHATAMTRVPAVRWSPAHLAVTVPVAVTHPVAVAFPATLVHTEH